MNRFFPRLHHGNVELRTAYLDNAVREIVKDAKDPLLHSDSHVKIRLVCMGAGYDTRGVKMLEQGIVDMVVELDLPEVVDAKQRLFERLRMRRPGLVDVDMPELIPSDFNDVPDVEKKLQQVLKDDTNGDWHTIFMFEGVMIYLNDGVPSSLLNVTSNALIEKGLQGSLCLADRLENVPGGDQDMGGIELERNGWRIIDWCPKPGLARHMLRARLEATK
jgi:O-methyltransferase involved in polyketide biosynthesis